MGQAAENQKYYSFEEYLELEAQTNTRYQLYDGEVFAMAGTSDTHNEIVQNLSFALRESARQGGCKVYAENVKLEVVKNQYYTYPDVFICCDARDRQERMIKRYPVLIGEVLSASTEKADRGFKWLHYKKSLP
ncbi:MAG: Uma2 family endonuclease [Bacteroidia bacterium]|nr:Uma2 family endonuclease [Bacteroidia bacterium]